MRKKIQHVMPPIGTILIHKTRGKGKENETLNAKVIKTESKTGVGILVGNKTYASMTGAACAASGYNVDGWIYWKIKKK